MMIWWERVSQLEFSSSGTSSVASLFISNQPSFLPIASFRLVQTIGFCFYFFSLTPSLSSQATPKNLTLYSLDSLISTHYYNSTQNEKEKSSKSNGKVCHLFSFGGTLFLSLKKVCSRKKSEKGGQGCTVRIFSSFLSDSLNWLTFSSVTRNQEARNSLQNLLILQLANRINILFSPFKVKWYSTFLFWIATK